MKMSQRFAVSGVLALIMGAACFGQHYTQTNLVSNESGAAPVTDPQLINPWGISRGSGSAWWVSNEQEHPNGYTNRHHLQRQSNRFFAGPRQTSHVPLLHE